MESKKKKLISLLEQGDVDAAKQLFSNKKDTVEKALQYYNIENHPIYNKHGDKVIQGEDGEIKEKIMDWGLPIAYQQKIVQMSAVFLFGKPVRLIQESKGTDEAFEVVREIWEEMRQDGKNLTTAQKLFSETECAKLFRPYRDQDADVNDTTKPNTIRCRVLAKSEGDDLYVMFNEFGGMEAFARGYKVELGDGQKVDHFDIETPEYYFDCARNKDKWEVTVKHNLTKKINVAYYSVEKWDSYLVDRVIERRETLTSRRANNNDAMGEPLLILKGSVSELPGVSNDAKVVVMDPGGDASYLYPQLAVDLIKEEREDLEKIINYITDTIDLSSESLKSMGQDSGKALIMRFFPAELKAIYNRIQFKEMLGREINIIKNLIATTIHPTNKKLLEQLNKLKIKIEFSTPLPDNVDELIEMLSTATGGKPTLSQEEAANLNPLTKDGASNWEKLQKEAKEEIVSLDV